MHLLQFVPHCALYALSSSGPAHSVFSILPSPDSLLLNVDCCVIDSRARWWWDLCLHWWLTVGFAVSLLRNLLWTSFFCSFFPAKDCPFGVFPPPLVRLLSEIPQFRTSVTMSGLRSSWSASSIWGSLLLLLRDAFSTSGLCSSLFMSSSAEFGFLFPLLAHFPFSHLLLLPHQLFSSCKLLVVVSSSWHAFGWLSSMNW